MNNTPVSLHPDPLPRGEGTPSEFSGLPPFTWRSLRCARSNRGNWATKRRSILPLPTGEGRGEGEQGVGTAQCLNLRPGARPLTDEPCDIEPFIISSARISLGSLC